MKCILYLLGLVSLATTISASVKHSALLQLCHFIVMAAIIQLRSYMHRGIKLLKMPHAICITQCSYYTVTVAAHAWITAN